MGEELQTTVRIWTDTATYDLDLGPDAWDDVETQLSKTELSVLCSTCNEVVFDTEDNETDPAKFAGDSCSVCGSELEQVTDYEILG